MNSENAMAQHPLFTRVATCLADGYFKHVITMMSEKFNMYETAGVKVPNTVAGKARSK